MSRQNKNNILTTSELVTISILQSIKIDLLLEKARIQRNGTALEEQCIDAEPQEYDYFPQSDEKLVAGATTTFEALIDAQLNSPPSKADDCQISIDEAITQAQDMVDTFAATKKKSKKSDKTVTANVSKVTRLHAWLAARGAWRVRRAMMDYEYARTKADVTNMCYGLDYCVGLLDREIERQSSKRGIKVSDVTDEDKEFK